MRNKCPPGVLCIENMTLFFIIFIVFIVIYFLFNILNKTNMNVYNLETSKTNCNNNFNKNNQGLFPKPSYSFSNVENDVLLNPYEAPLRDNRIFPDSGISIVLISVRRR